MGGMERKHQKVVICFKNIFIKIILKGFPYFLLKSMIKFNHKNLKTNKVKDIRFVIVA